jgi:uncharacterized protein YjdB/PKD repeat protein
MPKYNSIPRAALLLATIGLSLLTCRSDVPTDPSLALVPLRPSLATAGAPEVFVGAGQVTRCDGTNDEATANLLDNITGTVFVLGDNVRASGSAADYTNCYGPSWGRHKARTRPSAGNLDYQTSGAAGYFGYFGAAAGAPAKGYYSFDLGDWHVIVLNSNIATTANSAQVQWLIADLAASTKHCTLAYWHHPRFSSIGTAVRASVKPLWDALYAAEADVVLSAHYRVYERFAPQRPDGAADPAQGIRQFTVGTGGHGVEPFGTIQPNSQARSSGVFGVLKLTLTAGSYSWEFVPVVAGQSFSDTGSGDCHKAPPTPVASVEVTPASASVPAGQTVQLTATPRDDQGNPVSRPVTWSTSAPSVATVSSTGLVTGVAQGSATITALSDGHEDVADITVTSAPPPPSSVVLVGAGDIASCDVNTDEATAVLLDGIPGTVIALGDNAYPNGTAQEFQNCYDPTWGRHKARTRPVVGNHEYHTPGASAYFQYFGAAAGEPDKGYYSYEAGAWHVIVLNDNIDATTNSLQVQWLRADLAAHPNQCVVAMWHAPRYTSVEGRGVLDRVKPFWDALYEAGADLILNGHDHSYERFAPQRPDGTADPTFGIRQITAGTGGQSLYAFGTIAANSEVRNNVSRGVVKLTLSAGSYTWQFIPIAGQSFTDSDTSNCHGVAGGSNQPPVAQPGGPYSGNEGAPVSFNGTGSSDPENNTPFTYAWNYGDGTTGTGATPSKIYAANANYTVSLSVTDSRGATSAAATTTATIVNVAPTVNAGPDVSLTVGQTLSLSVTFSDPGTGDAPWAYTIDWGDGSSGSGSAGTQAAPIAATHTFAATGEYTVRATVTDKDGGARSDDLGATVTATSPPNQAPIGRPGGPYTGNEGAAVAFNGSASSDPDGNTPLTYAWNFGDGTNGTGASPSHVYAQNGNYTTSLTVTDSRGLAGAAATASVSIANVAPTVNAGPDVMLTAGSALNLSASFTDPGTGDGPWAYAIEWGDGGTQNGNASAQATPITASHTYSATGTFVVRVTVTDAGGAAGNDQLSVTVNPVAAAQVIVAAGNIANCGHLRDDSTAALIDNIPGTVIVLGDNAFPNGSLSTYNNCYGPSWGRHKARTYAALGNHDYDTGTANGAFDYFGARAGPRGLGYYSFDLGDWHIIVLNNANASQMAWGAGSTQEQWLRVDLAANTKLCTMAVFHYPRFFSSDTQGWNSSSSIKILWDDLYAAGADVVLNGQQHFYERFPPMTPSGVRDDARGIRSFNAGSGGDSVLEPTAVAPLSEIHSTAFGVLKMTLEADRYGWQFVPMVPGQFTDSGSGTCH